MFYHNRIPQHIYNIYNTHFKNDSITCNRLELFKGTLRCHFPFIMLNIERLLTYNIQYTHRCNIYTYRYRQYEYMHKPYVWKIPAEWIKQKSNILYIYSNNIEKSYRRYMFYIKTSISRILITFLLILKRWFLEFLIYTFFERCTRTKLLCFGIHAEGTVHEILIICYKVGT